jgi:hypothetical protein
VDMCDVVAVECDVEQGWNRGMNAEDSWCCSCTEEGDEVEERSRDPGAVTDTGREEPEADSIFQSTAFLLFAFTPLANVQPRSVVRYHADGCASPTHTLPATPSALPQRMT